MSAQDAKLQDKKSELKRVQAKKAASDDKDIKAALQLRIDALEIEIEELSIKVLVPEVEEVVIPENIEPLSADQKIEVDNLIRKVRVEQMRENNAVALKLLQEAEKIAPYDASVLEAVGDMLVVNRKSKEALQKYEVALKVQPQNLSVAKKHAELTFKVKANEAGIEVSNLLKNDGIRHSNFTKIITFLLPGLGQVLQGDEEIGYTIVVIWLVLLAWIASHIFNFASLVGAVMQRPVADPKPISRLTIAAIVVAVLVYIASMVHLKLTTKSSINTNSSGNVAPPVNLPF